MLLTAQSQGSGLKLQPFYAFTSKQSKLNSPITQVNLINDDNSLLLGFPYVLGTTLNILCAFHHLILTVIFKKRYYYHPHSTENTVINECGI